MNVSTRTTIPTIAANCTGTQNYYPEASTRLKPAPIMRWLFVLCMVALTGVMAKGQTLANYTFSTATNATLEDLSVGATDLLTGNKDDNATTVAPIGFPVLFMGTVYTHFSANSNGQMRLHTSSGATAIGTNVSSPALNAVTLAPFSGDNEVNNGIRYKVVGTAPNRKLVVEWNQFYINFQNLTNAGNMQLWLNEANNEVDYVYGEIYNSATSSQTRSIFISSSNTATTAGSITINTSPTAPTFALGATPASNTIAAGANPTGAPLIDNIGSSAQGSRRIFSWVPNAPIAGPTALTFSNVGITSLTLNWTASSPQTGVLGYIAYASSDGGVTYNPVGMAIGSATTTMNITGLTGSTTYLWKVYAYAEGNLSATSADDVQATNSCSMNGTYTVGATGTYTNLTAALAALNLQGAAGAVVFELQSDYSSSGETFPLVLGNVPCMSASNTVTIRPAAGATVSVTGLNTTALFDVNGGNYFIIDGRQGGSGASGLTISNTGNGPAIRFINEGSNNTVKYSSISSAATATANGVIVFSTTTGANGNDNNTISNNDISGNGVAATLIYSSGTASKTNSGETVSNNSFHDQFVAGSSTNGIYVSSNSTGWTISGNSFYQTAARTYTTGSSHYGIYVATGDGHSITGNYIGGSQVNAGGTAYTLNGAVATLFRGIYSAGSTTTANTITGNTISNIALTSSSTSATNPGVFSGIYLSTGLAGINNNTISSISITSTANGGISTGIGSASTTTGNVTINNNTIGGITIQGSTASYGSSFTGIWNSGSLAGSLTISGNTIGHNTNANSINFVTATTGTSGGTLIGINNSGTPTGGATISNNIIANLNTNYAPSAAFSSPVVRGIVASSAVVTVSGNSIHDLYAGANATGTGANASVQGISISTATAGASTVTSNTIYSLENSNVASVIVTGIYWAGPTGGKVNRNLVYGIYSPTIAGQINGIQVNSAVDCQNNMVRLGIDASGASKTTASPYVGIFESSASNILHNTVYIGGTGVNPAPATATYAFRSSVTTGTRQVLNNIFMNARSSASAAASHYAIRLTGITDLTINGNDYVANGAFTGVLGSNNGTDVTSLAAWKAFTTQDANSISADPCLNNPTAGTPNLHLTDCSGAGSPADGAGVITGVANDFDGDVRANYTPIDIGADAGNYGLTGLNVGLSALVSPANPVTGCLTNAESVIVTLTNFDLSPIDFSVNPVTVTVTTSGGYSSTTTLNTGTLAAAGNMSVTMPATIDMTGRATYTFNGSATVVGDVNTSNDAMPATSIVVNSLTGTYTVGSGGNFTTLTDAVAAYKNSSCLNGPVVFSLTDASYSETYPISIEPNAQASAVNTLTIRPAAGVTPAFSGSAADGLIKIKGADYITIDGSNNGTNTRDLSFTNTYTTGSPVIWVASVGGAGNGANHVTLKNLNVIGGSNTNSSTYGIVSAGTGYTAAAEDNDYLTLQNNSIKTVYTGIKANYSSTVGLQGDNLVISQNSIGSVTAAEYVLFHGIDVSYVNAPDISNNTIFNILQTGSVNVSGIEMGANVIGGTINANTIQNIQSTSSGGWGAYGINFSGSGTTNVMVSNNMISGIMTSNYSVSGTTYNAFGIRIAASGSNLKIFHNSINMYGDVGTGSSAGMSANLVITAAVTGLDVKDNIFVNKQNFGIAGSKAYNVYATAVIGGSLDYNDYYGVTTPTTTYITGYPNSSDQASLANWQTATGFDANSVSIQPVFTADDNLHLTPSLNASLDNKGTNVGITTDFDGDTRSLTTPDVGADEFTAPVVLDVSLSALTAPVAGGCYSNAEAVTVTVTNNTPFAVDLSVNPVTVTVTATGGYSSTTTLNTGTLAASGAQSVTMPASIDLSVPGTYTFNGSATVTGDVNTGNDALTPAVNIVSSAVAVGTISSSMNSFCVTGGIPTLTLSSAAGGTIQWQESNVSNSGPWTNVGTNSLTYTPSSAITATTYYQAVVTCTISSTSITSSVLSVPLYNPSITGTTPATRCGEGTVTLGATGSAGTTLNWYASASGGASLGTGTSFTTPSISNTTNYYVEPTIGGSVSYVGPTYSGSLTNGTNIGSHGIAITTTKAGVLITSADIPFTGTGTFTISLKDVSNTTTITSVTTGSYTGTGTTAITIPLNLTVSTPGNYLLMITAVSGTINNLGYTDGVYPYTTLDNSLSITDGYWYGSDVADMYLFNLGVFTGCAGNRQMVTATITTPPTVALSASQTDICAGQSSNLSVTSSNDPDYTYTWTPGNLSGASQTVTPATTTTYTLNASDNTNGPNAGCATSGTITITVNPLPEPVVVSPTAPIVCVGGNVSITATSQLPLLVSNYSFVYSSGASLDPMTGATAVISSGDDDTPTSSSAPIGFTFNLNGTAYSDYSVSPDGWLLLGTTAASGQYSNVVTSTTNIPKIYPLWDDLATGTDGSVKVLVTGTAPNRIFKVQWQVTIPRNTSGAFTSTYQAWLYEGSDKIEFRYGAMGTPGSASAGITASATNYQSITFSSNTASTSTSDDANSVAPAAGTMYTFAPAFYPITWSPATDLNTSSGNTVISTPTATRTYTATATRGACTTSNTVTVTLSDLALPTPSTTDVLCNGGATGTITAAASGGTTPYNYSIDGGVTWQGSGSFTGLAAGTYTVQVKDANSPQCTVSASTVTINEPTALTVSIGNQSDATCFGTATGTITASAGGGTAGYTYSIAGPTVNSTGDATGAYTGLLAGNYTITATDANNCTATSTQVTLNEPPAPSISAGNNGPVCDGSNVTLTATPSGYASYSWSGPGTINNANTDVATGVTPADNAVYTVTITDGSGCSNTASTTVSVVNNAAVSVSISVAPDVEICSGATATFTATPVNGGATPTYKWYVNGVEQLGETNSTFVTTAINDQDQVYCEVTSSITCTTGSPATSNTITMTVAGLITADVTLAADNSTVCDGSSVTLTATPTGSGNFPVYDFYLNNSLVQTGSSLTYTYVPANGDQVYVVMTSSFDCAIGSPATSNTETITVNPVPAAPVITPGGATTFCNGGSVTLTSSYVGGNTWSTSETTDAITVTTSGSYTVTQTALGCTSPASAPVVVTVNDNPTATVTGPVMVCTGSTITLSAATSTAGSGTITMYQWYDGVTPMGTAVTQDVTTSGSYTVVVTNSNGCTNTSAVYSVTENTPPVAGVTASCLTLGPGQTSTLTATPATGVTYSWTLNGGPELSTANPYTTAANVGGTYAVTVTAGNGCTGTASQVISAMTGALVGGNTYNVPSSCGGFPTIAAAVSYLNGNGVTGAGDVTIAVAAGYSESVPATGLVLTASGTATNQIKFVINGVGTATINAGTGGTGTPSTAVIDAMFKIVGGDYITIDGFTFTDGNTANPATMEAGVALLKADGTNGSQYNTISNNTFNMQRVNNAALGGARVDGAVGVAIYNTTNAASAAVATTAASGANSYNKVYGNTFNGGNTGVALIGFADATPFNYADRGNDIGGTSVATGNQILNFGGGASTNPAVGIRTLAQYDLNVSYNTINNNNGSGVNHATTLRGIYLNTATSAAETITHNTITVTSGGTTTQLTAIENAAGSTAASNTVDISNNSITTSYATAGATSGATYGIYNSASAANVNINSNTLAMSANTSSGSNYAIYNGGSVATALVIDGNSIASQAFTKAGSATFYGFYITSLTGTCTINNNSITGVSSSGAQTGPWAFVYKSASGTTETVTNNVVNNVTTATTGQVSLFYLSNSNTGGTIANNSITTQFTRTASGVFYGIYNFGGPGGTTNIHDNNFSNVSLNSTSTATLGSSSGSQMIFWGTGSGNPTNFYNNTFNNITQAGTGSTYGITSNYVPGSVYGNSFTNWTAAGDVCLVTTGSSSQATSIYNNTLNTISSSAVSGKIYGVYLVSNSQNNSVYGNQINNFTVSGATSPQVHGVYVAGGSATNAVYKNKIYGLTASAAIATLNGSVNGITLAGGTNNNVYNNYIGSLTAPLANLADVIRGINITSVAASTTENVSFNTIYLNASSTGTNFGTSGIYATANATATTATLNLRSNLIVNNSTANGTGLTVAYRRSAVALGNYGAASDNNLYYAGTPSANSVIFYDGTNSDLTLAGFKTRVATRDGDSKTENPPFLSTTGSDPTYLHINTTVQTLVESGGVNVAGITDDYDGDIRYGNPGYTGTSVLGPDMGADEFDGLAPDCDGAVGGTASPATLSVCASNTVSNLSVSGASSGAGISYQWQVSTTQGGPYSNVVGGSGANTQNYTTATGLAAGTYYYVLQVHCTTGDVTGYSTEIAYTVKPVPTATASSNSPVCSGSPLNLTGSSDIGTGFAWTGPNGFTSTTQSPSIASPTTAATGTYNLIATLNGCSSTAGTTSVVVNETPSAITVSPASAILCQGATQQLTASGGTLSTPITLYSEGFNNPTNNWTTTNLSTGGTPADAAWTLRPDGYVYSSTTFHSNDNSQFYQSNSDVQGSGSTTDTYLTSPALSTTGLSAASLNFNHYYYHYSSGNSHGYVQASTDGITWTTLQDYTATQGTATAFAAASVPLTAPFLNQPTVYVRFNFNVNWGFYWSIDNVSLVTPATAPIVWSPAADLYLDAGATLPYTNENVTTVYVKSNNTLTVTASATNNGCSSSGTANLIVNPAPAGNMQTGTLAVCQNSAAPTITFTGTSGTAPYTFTYTINGGAPQTAVTGAGANPQSVTVSVPTGTAGTYTYDVSNVADIYCSAAITGSYAVTVNPSYTLTVTPTVTPRSACGPTPDGSITLAVSGGTSPYTYAWTGVTGSGNPATTPYPNPGNVSAISNLQYGFYNVTVTDGGCGSTTLTNIHVGLGFPPVVTAQSSSSSSCNSTGSILAYASGGVAPYTFQLDGGPAQGSNSFTNVAGGSHTITATDAKGCASTINITVASAPVVGFTSYAYSASSCSNDGSIQIYRSGGVPPYSYSVDGSPFVGNSLFTGLAAGVHSVTIQDGNGCQATQNVTVGQGAGLTVTSRQSNTSACVNDGTIQVVVAGGVAPYSYSLNGGPSQGSNNFTGLAAGNYVATVTDSRGCTGTVNVTINVNNISVTFYKTDAPTCAGTGSVTLYRAGGTGPYTYSLDGNNYQASNVFTNLAPGTYTGYVKDSKTCVGQTVDGAIIIGPNDCEPGPRGVVKAPVASESLASVKAFPNPSVDEFTLDLKGFNMKEKVSITVTDLLGRKVYQTEGIGNMQYKIGKRLFAGMYNVMIVQGDKKFAIKVVKE